MNLTEQDILLLECEEISVKELISLNLELVDEIMELKYKRNDKMVDEAFRKIHALESELKSIKNSRDQFQFKNADLIRQVNYWKKKSK
jgi:hypothetical protein